MANSIDITGHVDRYSDEMQLVGKLFDFQAISDAPACDDLVSAGIIELTAGETANIPMSDALVVAPLLGFCFKNLSRTNNITIAGEAAGVYDMTLPPGGLYFTQINQGVVGQITAYCDGDARLAHIIWGAAFQ